MCSVWFMCMVCGAMYCLICVCFVCVCRCFCVWCVYVSGGSGLYVCVVCMVCMCVWYVWCVHVYVHTCADVRAEAQGLASCAWLAVGLSSAALMCLESLAQVDSFGPNSRRCG